MTPRAEDLPNSAAATGTRHSSATLRALNTSRELVMLLRSCDAVLRRAKTDVGEEGMELVLRISEDLAAAVESAELLQQKVLNAAHERSGFWEPAADPYASIRRRLARRVQNAA